MSTQTRIGITGCTGFIGSHLAARVRTREDFRWIPCERDVFLQNDTLDRFVESCDVIFHLAAMNRGAEEEIYQTNVSLVEKLLASLERTGTRPRVVFASSTQQDRPTAYGRSKKEGAALFQAWAQRNHAQALTAVIPNVFGPAARPFHNSVVATFAWQITHGQSPEVIQDKNLELIHVDELVEKFMQFIQPPSFSDECISISPTTRATVTGILEHMQQYASDYYEHGKVPAFRDRWQRYLYTSWISYMDPQDFRRPCAPRSDERGSLFELIKANSGGQTFFSTTRPQVTRGNHYHCRKSEKFCVVQGTARILMRRVDQKEIYSYDVDAAQPCVIEIPVFHTHNITNTGTRDLLTLFWTSEIFNPQDADTYYEKI